MISLETLLSAPISWENVSNDPDSKDFLDDLQANILKGHGRHHSAHIFLSFKSMKPDAVASVIRALGRQCTSAGTQLRRNKRLPPHMDGGTVRCMFLAAGGYHALGSEAGLPSGTAFAEGMASRQAVLNDPPRKMWDDVGWRDHVPDAMFLIADGEIDVVNKDVQDLKGWLKSTGVDIVAIERGLQQTRQFQKVGDPEGVEHFGYVDGRSQPLFLQEDLDRENQNVAAEPADPHNPAGKKWSAEFKPSQFIVADPNGKLSLSAGSYFVFRKLEQDVRGFNAAEDALGHALFGEKATRQELDRAGAMVVGRYEDGTPLVLSDQALAKPVPNGFTFGGDPDGARCPFHAHIRKTNPRGDVKREFGLPDESGDRNPIMARRGITYGPERPMNKDHSEFADTGVEPQHGSGLLFMAYMASLEAQFEFTQKSWANNPNFVRPLTGVDPVIGQTATASEREHTYLDGHTAGAVPKKLTFESFVHMKGGEYFFAPSLSFLRSVGTPALVAANAPLSGSSATSPPPKPPSA